MHHRLDDIIALFDGVFFPTYHTRLVRGDDEPLYRPADRLVRYHRIVFARGFYASALHEISHWCIAGESRRLKEDYGYWYLPDGRDTEQQRDFESVEIAPQALESLFSRACGLKFNVSVDNLGEVEVDRETFQTRVAQRAERYEREGLPKRAASFRSTLQAFYREGLTQQEAIEQGRQRLMMSPA
ncbi:elongation factor P hydroxylase [Litchfieldella xinjiangensis]|uniref:elongation factor P hydroxylase n=1 Tax=Litchfieldella xinjiangensis TaxID=1166948 RepID=UPI0005BDC15E|nr:elongation factor P hydroxylase [Halomonas xinjiangensis]